MFGLVKLGQLGSWRRGGKAYGGVYDSVGFLEKSVFCIRGSAASSFQAGVVFFEKLGE